MILSLNIGKIKPILKKGNTNLYENYRPITLLTSFSKIFTECTISGLKSFFDKFRLLNKNQFGFKKGWSTCDAITKFTNFTYENLDKERKYMRLIFDLSMVIDLVNHTFLSLILERYGI